MNSSAINGAATGAGERVLNGKTAAFEVLEIVEFDGSGGGFDGFEIDVAESVSDTISKRRWDVYAFICRDI